MISTGFGLSPRVRGNLAPTQAEDAKYRSIPACAGEPQGKRDADAGTRVYPRVCGGTEQNLDGGSVTRGLSPRVRGNP